MVPPPISRFTTTTPLSSEYFQAPLHSSSIPIKSKETPYLTADGSPKTSFQAVSSVLVNSLTTVGAVGSYPVSYTHLDVYKRQIIIVLALKLLLLAREMELLAILQLVLPVLPSL